MKKIYLFLITFIVCSSLFFACTIPWDMGDAINRLKDDVVFMGMVSQSINGHDKTTLNFVDSTFTSENYSYDFATAAAETAGNHTDQSWYQTGGMTGSFTYDNETKLLTMTTTQVYMQKAGASTTYSTDYEWHTIVAADETASWAGSVFKAMTMTTLLTQDGMIPAYAGSGDGNWGFTMNMTAVDGSYQNSTQSLSISATTVIIIDSSDEGAKDAAASAIAHSLETYTYTVTNFFLSGEETGDKEFSKVWKEGNAVCFILSRTRYTELDYAGATAPTIPTADPVTGTASTGSNGVDYASIDIEADGTDIYPFTHFGDCIISSQYLLYAVRGLE